jgi:GntR family transcriptional regulator/MocR family aminotransferase
VPSAAGLHVCALLRPGAAIDLEEVARRAEERGVAVRTLAGYCADEPPLQGLVIGYGAITRDRIPEGLRLLAECFRSQEP